MSVAAMLFNVLLAGLLLGAGGPTPATESSLIAFLDQTYSQGGSKATRAIGRFSSFLSSGKPLPPTAASIEGRQVDGSYLWSAMFNPNSIRTFGYPRAKLEKFCLSSGGTFAQTMALNPEQAQSTAAKVTTATAAVRALDPRYVILWRAHGVPEERIDANWRNGYFFALLGAQSYRAYGWLDGVVDLLQRNGNLGVFSCAHEGRETWAVSVVPSSNYKFQTVTQHDANLLENSWWALSIRPQPVR